MKRRNFAKGLGTAATALPLFGCSTLSGIERYRKNMPKGGISRITLGRTGIRVSRLGFGSHLKPELIARPRYRDKMIKLGFEGGINIYDVYDHDGYKQFAPMGKSLKDFRKEAIVSLCVVKPTEEVQGEIDGALKSITLIYIAFIQSMMTVWQ